MELRDGSLIKVTPLNSEFGEALYVKPLSVSGLFVLWDEETIRLKGVGVPFKGIKGADVFYDIPVAEARKIIFKKAAKQFDTGKTVVAAVGVAVIALAFTVFTLALFGDG